jgi:hypothetical protein
MNPRTVIEHERDYARAATHALKELGLSQEEIAKRMKMTFPSFAAMLRGEKCRNIPIERFHALQNVMLGAMVEHQERAGMITRSQFLAVLGAGEELVDLLDEWRKSGKALGDPETVELLRVKNTLLDRHLRQVIEQSARLARIRARFPEKREHQVARA